MPEGSSPADAAGWGIPGYRSARGVAVASATLLLLFLVLTLASTLYSLLSVERGLDGERTLRTLPGWVALGGALLTLPLLVLVPMWLARSYRNVQALTGRALKGSAGWAAGAWFVPLLGGFLAAPALARMWREGPGRHRYLPLLWALFWSLYQLGFVATIATGLALAGPELSATASWEEQAARLEEVAPDILPLQAGTQGLLLVSGTAMALTILLFTRWEEAESHRRTP